MRRFKRFRQSEPAAITTVISPSNYMLLFNSQASRQIDWLADGKVVALVDDKERKVRLRKPKTDEPDRYRISVQDRGLCQMSCPDLLRHIQVKHGKRLDFHVREGVYVEFQY